MSYLVFLGYKVKQTTKQTKMWSMQRMNEHFNNYMTILNV